MKSFKEEVFVCDEKLELETGDCLDSFQLQYGTIGELNEDKDNVIWVCHALTGSHEFHIWWEGLFGEGGYFASSDHFIICANMLGGCNGSTGPLSDSNSKKGAYYHDFPNLTNRDIVAAFDRLRESLGISSINTLIGGSLGGQQALEWAITKPNVFENLILVATNAQHSPWGIAFNESQRMAIQCDPTWAENRGDAGISGMKAARAAALLSYRNYKTYALTQSEASDEQTDSFRASSYQQYQGEKLAQRFNAFTYWLLSKAMDSHNVGRGRGGVPVALGQVRASTLVIGVDTDILFPLNEQELLAEFIEGASFEVVHSDYGHDGFLIETKRINEIINQFYKTKYIKQKIV